MSQFDSENARWLMEQKRHGVEKLRVYMDAKEIASMIFSIVNGWDNFSKNAMGSQLVRSADSVVNNLVEGYARSSTADRINFILYSESSLQEARNQVHIATERGLIPEGQCCEIEQRISRLSMNIIEFCHALIESDPNFKGKQKDYIDRRRAWKLKPKNK